MSKRLQVLLDERELGELQQLARQRGVPLSEWVRTALREASSREQRGGIDRKLDALRAAVKHEFPSGEIEDMLAEIDRGYSTDLPT